MSDPRPELAAKISAKMEELAKLLPSGYRMTLVARPEDGNLEAGMTFSDDPNIDGVIELIRRSQNWSVVPDPAPQARAGQIIRRRRKKCL
jgi:hypothetical protein